MDLIESSGWVKVVFSSFTGLEANLHNINGNYYEKEKKPISSNELSDFLNGVRKH